MVTAMSRNGVNFGIRLSGTGERWFEAPANPVDGLYFPGYSIARRRAPISATSAITETAGVGGFAMAAAPAIVKFVGGTPHGRDPPQPADARHHARRATRVHAAGARLRRRRRPASTRARWSIRGMLPVINSGIAHREAGVGQIGAGITRGADGVLQRRP